MNALPVATATTPQTHHATVAHLKRCAAHAVKAITQLCDLCEREGEGNTQQRESRIGGSDFFDVALEAGDPGLARRFRVCVARAKQASLAVSAVINLETCGAYAPVPVLAKSNYDSVSSPESGVPPKGLKSGPSGSGVFLGAQRTGESTSQELVSSVTEQLPALFRVVAAVRAAATLATSRLGLSGGGPGSPLASVGFKGNRREGSPSKASPIAVLRAAAEAASESLASLSTACRMTNSELGQRQVIAALRKLERTRDEFAGAPPPGSTTRRADEEAAANEAFVDVRIQAQSVAARTQELCSAAKSDPEGKRERGEVVRNLCLALRVLTRVAPRNPPSQSSSQSQKLAFSSRR
jgi:hypothetical protein